MNRIKPKKRRVLGALKRSRRLTMNLTAEEHEQLELKAGEAGVPVAVFARRVSLEGKVIARMGPEDRELFRVVVGVSNVLDGFYKLARSAGEERLAESLVGAREVVDGLLNKLNK